jgi:hypothetical protein
LACHHQSVTSPFRISRSRSTAISRVRVHVHPVVAPCISDGGVHGSVFCFYNFCNGGGVNQGDCVSVHRVFASAILNQQAGISNLRPGQGQGLFDWSPVQKKTKPEHRTIV